MVIPFCKRIVIQKIDFQMKFENYKNKSRTEKIVSCIGYSDVTSCNPFTKWCGNLSAKMSV